MLCGRGILTFNSPCRMTQKMKSQPSRLAFSMDSPDTLHSPILMFANLFLTKCIGYSSASAVKGCRRLEFLEVQAHCPRKLADVSPMS